MNAEDKLERLLLALERLRLEEYLMYVGNRKRLLANAFWTGVLRGLGGAVGFTLLGAVVIALLQKLVLRDVPLLGSLFAQLLDLLEKKL